MDNKESSRGRVQHPGVIFLTGMPAAGKTFWGGQWAREYDLPFVDLDSFIANEERASVPALFAQYGEAGFRERESKHLRQLIGSGGDMLMACGGGTPCFADNMTAMKAAGIVVYLQAEVETLLENIQAGDEVRPLLKGRGDLGLYLQELLDKRKACYEQAHIILPTKDISLTTFGEIIASCIDGQ